MVLRSTKHSAAVLANVPIAVGADVVTDAHSTPKPLGLAGAFLFAVAMTEGKTRLISAPIAAFCVALMSIGMLDYYVGVFWPDPVLQQWIAVRL